MQILVTIGSEIFAGAGVGIPTFPLTYAVVHNALRHYHTKPECDDMDAILQYVNINLTREKLITCYFLGKLLVNK